MIETQLSLLSTKGFERDAPYPVAGNRLAYVCGSAMGRLSMTRYDHRQVIALAISTKRS